MNARILLFGLLISFSSNGQDLIISEYDKLIEQIDSYKKYKIDTWTEIRDLSLLSDSTVLLVRYSGKAGFAKDVEKIKNGKEIYLMTYYINKDGGLFSILESKTENDNLIGQRRFYFSAGTLYSTVEQNTSVITWLIDK